MPQRAPPSLVTGLMTSDFRVGPGSSERPWGTLGTGSQQLARALGAEVKPPGKAEQEPLELAGEETRSWNLERDWAPLSLADHFL